MNFDYGKGQLKGVMGVREESEASTKAAANHRGRGTTLLLPSKIKEDGGCKEQGNNMRTACSL